jgi:hypothetical protein
MGFVEITGPEGSVVRETYTCCHCNGLDFVPEPGTAELGFCMHCMSRECVGCAKRLQGRCAPFEKQIETYERRQRLMAVIANG